MLIDIKYYPQLKPFTCGPVCLKMVFEHLGKKYSREKLIKMCKSVPKVGTSHDNITKVAKKERFVCIDKNKSSVQELVKYIEAGHPVIVNYFSPLSHCGHYAVAVGFDRKEEILIFADPANGCDYSLKWGEFEKMWHNGNNTSKRWLLVISREEIIA